MRRGDWGSRSTPWETGMSALRSVRCVLTVRECGGWGGNWSPLLTLALVPTPYPCSGLHSLPLHQVTFIDFIVYPLWETWAELVYPDAQDIVTSLMETRDQWQIRMVHSPPPTSEMEDLSPNTSTPVGNNTPKHHNHTTSNSEHFACGEESLNQLVVLSF